MKLRIFSLSLAFCILLFSFFVGSIFKSTITKVELITPDCTGYTRSVNCNGEIVEQSREDIYLSLPIIASEVRCSVGDYVQKGEILAVVDKAATATSLINSYTSNVNEMIYEAALNLPIEQLAQEISYLGNSVSLSDTLKSIPTYVFAGISGTVTAIDIHTNKPTKAYTSLVTIVDDSTLVAKVSVKEDNIDLISVGAVATLSGNAFGDEKYEAYVTQIYPSAYKKYDSLTAETVVDVIITPISTEHNLRSGYSTKANIIIEQVDFAITVPYECVLQDEENNEYVYVIEGGRAKKQYITTGLELSKGFEILDGVDETTMIIKDPNSVSNNQYVMVTNYEN